jgi:hypothetical protein
LACTLDRFMLHHYLDFSYFFLIFIIIIIILFFVDFFCLDSLFFTVFVSVQVSGESARDLCSIGWTQVLPKESCIVLAVQSRTTVFPTGS